MSLRVLPDCWLKYIVVSCIFELIHVHVHDIHVHVHDIHVVVSQKYFLGDGHTRCVVSVAIAEG